MAALPLIVFDVNETLLDLETMEPTFERIFGDKSAMRLWFADLILYSAALTVAGCYVPFTDIGSAVMKMLADTRGIKINDADKKELTEKFSTMPPHAEVPAALRKLRNAGFRLFCLTDNLLEVQARQLEHGGIVDLFERRFSADGVKHHKSFATSVRLCRERARRATLATLPHCLPHLGHSRRCRGRLARRADQACG
jgi:2-haloacid dehalogenase